MSLKPEKYTTPLDAQVLGFFKRRITWVNCTHTVEDVLETIPGLTKAKCQKYIDKFVEDGFLIEEKGRYKYYKTFTNHRKNYDNGTTTDKTI